MTATSTVMLSHSTHFSNQMQVPNNNWIITETYRRQNQLLNCRGKIILCSNNPQLYALQFLRPAAFYYLEARILALYVTK